MKSAKFITFTSVAIMGGFAVGLALGKATREQVNSNTKVDYANGVVTVRSDISKALRDGASSLISDLFN